MSFLYYIPGASTLDAAKAAVVASGLDLSNVAWRECYKGPGDTGGIILSRSAALARYEPDTQTWAECDGGKFWIGYYIATPPTPEDLERPDQVAGHMVELSDGHAWRIPVARQFPEGTRLPTNLILGRDGKIIRKVKPEYIELFNAAESIAEELYSTGGYRRSFDEVVELVSRTIAVNYLASKWELAASLQVFDDVNLRHCIAALVDIPTFEELNTILTGSKKNLVSDSLPTFDGSGVI